MNKSNSIFKMDEAGIKWNNPPGYVTAGKSGKALSMATSTKRGEI